MSRVAVQFAVLLSVMGSVAAAQPHGRVVGQVLDQTGAVLPGVTIDLIVNEAELTTATDDEGHYGFDAVPAGTAELTFRLLNFSVLRRIVRVNAGDIVTSDNTLTLSLKADVVVTGAATFRNIVDVENPTDSLVGIAVAASQGAVTASQLEVRPLRRPGEVLETVPGMVISQHSGEGKANQYYLRGFNLDHGTDFSSTVAGVPVNTPTGAHAHGYADLSFLIPELVSGVQFKKGPYFADEGDFSAAGAANINYVNRLERPLFELGGGDHGWRRAIAAASPRGLISRFGVLDPSDGGKASRQGLVAEYQRSRGPSSVRATAFLLHNSLNLFSNFTYLLDDPEHGDQFEQAERRTAAGGHVTYRRLGHLYERHTESAVGVQLRSDWLDPVGLYHTQGRQRLSTTREDQVGQTLASAFAQTEIEWTRALRTTAGLRADVYRFSVTSDNRLNSGDGSDAMVSPKFGAVLGPWAGTELYVNAGMGFHSNDARGATIRVDPARGEFVDRVTPLVRARGAEVGMRTVRVRGLQSTVALWYLGIDSELLFVGDAGTTEPGRPSRRVGLEWTNYARVRPWLTVDADLAWTHARFTDHDPAGNFVPRALDRVISAGLTVDGRQPVFGSLRVRHFGPRALIEDGNVQSSNSTLWNAEAGYRLSNKARLVLDVFNIFDARASDIDYFYTSRLRGEVEEGVDDIHVHPALPRSAWIGLQVSF
jgi:hypothetical protein